MNSGLRSSVINSEAKISSTAAGRSKFKLTCQMQACCSALRAPGGYVWIVSESPLLLMKQNTCVQVHSATETHRKLVTWKAVEMQEEKLSQKSYLLHILVAIQLILFHSIEKTAWFLTGWLSTYIGNVPGPSSTCLQPTMAARLSPLCLQCFSNREKYYIPYWKEFYYLWDWWI